MRISARAVVLLAGFAGFACVEDPDPAPAPDPSIELGDPCNWPWASCVDEATLLWCAEQRWTQTPCEQYCASLGAGVSSSGCIVELEAGSPTQLCACEPPAEGCTPGQAACESDDEIAWCGDDWAWRSSSCAQICAAQSLASLGCVAQADAAACLCTNIGTACEGEPSVCADAGSLARCVDGFWALVDCADECGGPGSCEPAAGGEAACAC